jgi:hypothetical protein
MAEMPERVGAPRLRRLNREIAALAIPVAEHDDDRNQRCK